ARRSSRSSNGASREPTPSGRNPTDGKDPMPPRYAYWTIILEGKPTAFRAHTAEELMPTLRQLQARHPDAVMKWFARGRLWHTPEEAQIAAAMKPGPASADRRTPNWRPGGEHRDPRERFKIPRDEK